MSKTLKLLNTIQEQYDKTGTLGHRDAGNHRTPNTRDPQHTTHDSTVSLRATPVSLRATPVSLRATPVSLRAKRSNLKYAKVNYLWIISLIILIMFSVIIGFNFKFFTMLKKYESDRKDMNETITDMQDLLKDYAKQAGAANEAIDRISKVLYSMDARLNNADVKMAELENRTDKKLSEIEKNTKDNLTELVKSIETQVSNFEALTRNEDMLIDRVSALETELDKLKTVPNEGTKQTEPTS